MEKKMLIPNTLQIEPKSADDIKSELAPDIRALKIDPDAREKQRNQQDSQKSSKKKKKHPSYLYQGKGALEDDTQHPDAYEVYNNSGRVVRLSLS